MTISEHNIIGRQPVVNDKQEIIGYEFFFNKEIHGNPSLEQDIETYASIFSVLVDELQQNWLLGQQLVFIRVDPGMLNSDFLELLPAEKAVLEITAPIEVTPQVLERCRTLKANKFRLALDNPQRAPSLEGLLQLADYIKLDMREGGMQQAPAWLTHYQASGCKLIAAHVEQQAQFQALQDMGYKLFQGYFYAKPEQLTAKVVNPSFEGVLHLLNLVSQDADNKP